MRLGVLFSGGKDSTYSAYLAKNSGHDIACLLTVFTESDESHLLHHSNIRWTALQSKTMKIPQLTISSNDDTATEVSNLEKILVNAKQMYQIEGLVHGGIKSKFQKDQFDGLCDKLQLQSIAPLWGKKSDDYMDELISNNFEFIVTSVSSDGLDDSWLGQKITKDNLITLKQLSVKFSFNLDFEGGEAETFVVNCPLFSDIITITQNQKIWDGYRGRFEIVEAELNNNAG